MPADGDTKGKTAPDQASAPRNGRRPERGGVRALRTIVLGLLPVVGIVVVGYLRFTTSQRAYIITSGYRALATGGRLVSARLDGLARELDRTHGKMRGFKSALRPVPVCTSSKATLLLQTRRRSIFRVLDNSGQLCIEYTWRDTASSPDAAVEKAASRPTSWNAAVSDLLPLSALGRVFDVVLVADEAGSIVLPPANDGVVLHHLDELQPVQKPARSRAPMRLRRPAGRPPSPSRFRSSISARRTRSCASRSITRSPTATSISSSAE